MLDSNSIRLRACRKRGGLDQAELSDLIGTRRGRISQIECGHTLPDTRILMAYAIAFDRRAEDLLPDLARRERRRLLREATRLELRCRNTRTGVDPAKLAFYSSLVRRLERARSS